MQHEFLAISQRRQRLVLESSRIVLEPVVDGGIVDPTATVFYSLDPFGVLDEVALLGPVDSPLE